MSSRPLRLRWPFPARAQCASLSPGVPLPVLAVDHDRLHLVCQDVGPLIGNSVFHNCSLSLSRPGLHRAGTWVGQKTEGGMLADQVKKNLRQKQTTRDHANTKQRNMKGTGQSDAPPEPNPPWPGIPSCRCDVNNQDCDTPQLARPSQHTAHQAACKQIWMRYGK